MQGPSYSERIAIVNRTRLVGAAGLVRALSDLNDSETERTICDRWLAATREDTTLCPDGWYQPPPGGVGVLIGHPPGFERMEYVSLRAPDIWPRDDIHFDEASLIYAYASPTNRATGLIGDIGVTLYRGSDPRLRDHLSSCIEIANRIAEFAEVGMELRELFHHGESLIADASARNRTSSATDSGARNIGHTVPWTYEDGSTTVTCGEGVSAADIAERIRRERVFLNASARLPIAPTMAFTVEPRLTSATLPLSSFHVIVTFLEGRKRVQSGFRALFELFGMDGYLPTTGLAG